MFARRRRVATNRTESFAWRCVCICDELNGGGNSSVGVFLLHTQVHAQLRIYDVCFLRLLCVVDAIYVDAAILLIIIRANRCVRSISKSPELRSDYPLNLSISVSGGKETKQDSPSNGE